MKQLIASLFTIGALAACQTSALSNDKQIQSKHQLFDDFNESQLSSHWRVGAPEYTQYKIENNALIGDQINPKHGATIRTIYEFDDGDIEFDFKFLNGTRFNLAMGDENAKKISWAGHICRVQFSPNKIFLRDGFTGHFNLAVRALPDKEREEKIKGTTRTIKLEKPLDKNVWHSAKISIRGDMMSVYINNALVGELTSPGIDHATKNRHGFTTTGKSIAYDNFKITRK